MLRILDLMWKFLRKFLESTYTCIVSILEQIHRFLTGQVSFCSIWSIQHYGAILLRPGILQRCLHPDVPHPAVCPGCHQTTPVSELRDETHDPPRVLRRAAILYVCVPPPRDWQYDRGGTLGGVSEWAILSAVLCDITARVVPSRLQGWGPVQQDSHTTYHREARQL